MSELYNRIEYLCQKAGINITEMCRRAGVPRSNLTELKMGRQQTIGPALLGKIADCFGVSVDYLLGAEEKENQPTGFDGLTEDEIQLLTAYRRIADEDKEAYLKIVVQRGGQNP